MDTLWRIEMLGGLRAVHDDRAITRFRSHQTGALLAYLAFYPHRSHPRDFLTNLLWPEDPFDSARARLRIALSSLRRQLEPPGIPAGAIVMADRLSAGLNPAAVTTDVARFEAALRSAGASSESARTQSLTEAIELYRGPLLPGYFDEWVTPEQQRLTRLFFGAVRDLIAHLEQAGDLARALDVAGRAIAVDPLWEEAYYDLIRLYAATGQPAAALRQYRELERRLRDELHETPSPALDQLVRSIERGEIRNWAPPVLLPTRAAEARSRSLTVAALSSGRQQHAAEETGGYLPPQVTRFFGRQREIDRIRRLLMVEGVRLVSLTGPGGSGKTRLALEAAARLGDGLEGAVWFVPLVDVSDPRRIIDTIHTSLRLPRRPQLEPLDQVVDALSRRPCLLVLDNLEQLLPGGVPILRDLLERSPPLQCLVTSRHVLKLMPEREIAVGPLPVPGVQAFRRSGGAC